MKTFVFLVLDDGKTIFIRGYDRQEEGSRYKTYEENEASLPNERALLLFL